MVEYNLNFKIKIFLKCKINYKINFISIFVLDLLTNICQKSDVDVPGQ